MIVSWIGKPIVITERVAATLTIDSGSFNNSIKADTAICEGGRQVYGIVVLDFVLEYWGLGELCNSVGDIKSGIASTQMIMISLNI